MDPSHDDKATSLTRRVAGRTFGRLRRLTRRARHGLRRALSDGFDDLTEAIREQIFELLSSPEQVEVLQRTLASVSSWAMSNGFRADPNAELLFEFVDWLEQRHGRRRITSILLHSQLVQDPAFLEALENLSQIATPWRSRDSSSSWTERQIDSFKERTGGRLLDLIVELAALERSDPPPKSRKDKISYFESSPMPVRFLRLAAMSEGDKLLRRKRRTQGRLARRALKRLAPTDSTSNGLIPFIPGVGDQHLHFLVFSTSFFLQTYLVRNFIEALPELAEEFVGAVRDDEEFIDIR